MVKYLNQLLKDITTALEFIISFILAAAICVMIFQLLTDFRYLADPSVYPNYNDLMTSCFNLIIGIEMIRMIYLHTQSTVFEVLLFAIARQIIIDHSSVYSSLIGVCAIAVLFATRKFLFCEFDVADEIIFRATSKAKAVNKILGINIPYEPGETLLDVLSRNLADHDIELGVGACFYFKDCGLRVAKMHDGKITRIEVIRAIH